MIRFFDVTKRYPNGVAAIEGLRLHIPEGDFVYLTGASGAGKTTLIKLLLAVEPVTSGEILVAGRNLRTLTRASIPRLRRNLGVVFQDFRLLPDRRVYENIAIGLEIRGLGRREIRRRVEGVAGRVGIERHLKAYPAELSGGEQQRVAIARAIAGDPPILLADEPTGNLDPELSLQIAALLDEIHAQGTTVLVATHDPMLPEHLPHRVVQLGQGAVQADTDPPDPQLMLRPWGEGPQAMKAAS